MSILPLDSSTAGAAGSSAPTGSTGSSGSSTTGSSAGSSAELSQLSNPQLFLQLLVAELQNQDPTNPMQPSTILQQTSELSNVEAMQSMTNQEGDLQATGLIGHTVTVNVNGSPVSGAVSSIALSSTGQPTFTVAGVSNPVSLSEITSVA